MTIIIQMYTILKRKVQKYTNYDKHNYSAVQIITNRSLNKQF